LFEDGRRQRREDRTAKEEELYEPKQWHALWRSVGEAMTQRLGARPVWLSIAGGGP
jgi:hypothetical protein